MGKIKRKHYLIGSIAFIIFLFLFTLSTIVKNYINNNSEKLLGRKIHLDELHLNYLKVQVKAYNFTLYEENKTDTFVYFKELLVNYDPWKMIHNEYAVSEIKLIDPFVKIIQDKHGFNFDSMIPEEDSIEIVNEEQVTTTNEDVKYSISNIKLEGGTINYVDKQIDNEISLDNLSLNLPFIAWNKNKSEMGVEFSIGDKGLVKINADVNKNDSVYDLNIITKNININSFTNYLKEYVNISELKGFTNSNIHIKGNLSHYDNILVSGKLEVNDIEVKDNLGDVLVKAAKIGTNLDTLDILNTKYSFNKIYADSLFITTLLKPETSNWQAFLNPVLSDTLVTERQGSEDSLITNDYLYYNIDTFQINNSTIAFEDQTLFRPFSYFIKDINVNLSHIHPNNDTISLKYEMNFNNQGKSSGELKFSINDPLKVFFKGSVTKLDLHSFSPYTEYYLGYPIITGFFNYDCDLNMDSASLNNNNHLLIKEMEFGKKTKDSASYNLPVKLALYLIKDANNNIEINLPVSGNPSEPGFNVRLLVWQTFKKFIGKTAAEPFKSLASLVGTQPGEINHIPIIYGQDSLNKAQTEILDNIYVILQKKEKLHFTFRQELSLENAINVLAEKSAKIKYLTDKNNSEITDWKTIQNDDVNFIAYINKLTPESQDKPLKDKFKQIIGDNELMNMFKKLYDSRNKEISDYLIKKGCSPANYTITNVDFANMSQELKEPGIRIEVSVN